MFAAKLIKKLNKLRCEGVLCDVFFQCGKQQFSAHKAVLAASCQYFQALFTTIMLEKDSSVINLEVPSSIADELLSFLYTGEVLLCAANCKELFIAADYLMLEDLKTQCENYFAASLSRDTCLQVYDLSVNYNCNQLTLKSEKLVLKHFGTVRKSGEFMALGRQHLERLTSSDELVVDNEEDVFHAIVSWVEYEPVERSQVIETLFQHVRLCSIPVQFITSIMAKHPLVRQNDVCMSMIFQRIQMELTTVDHDQTLRARKCLRTEDKAIVCLGGISGGKTLKDTIAYNPYRDQLTPLQDMPVEREEHVVVLGNDILYVIGGVRKPHSIDCYNQQSNSWSNEAVLPERVMSSAGVFVDGKIIIVGGRDGFQCVSTVQSYETASKYVGTLPALTGARKGMNAIAVDGDIYVIGGCTYDNDSLNTVERMRLGNGNKWEKMASLLHRRKYACAEKLSDGKILVVGGYQDTNPTALKTCEIYNPECNSWHEVCSLVIPRAVACMASVDNRVYIIGGRSDRVSTDTIEYYDEDAKEWTMMARRTPYACAWLQCGVISLDRSGNKQTIEK